MKKSSFKISVTCLLLLALFTLSSCIKTENVKWGLVKGVSLKKVNLNGLELVVTLPVENRNGGRIKVKDANFTVFADSMAVAKIKLANDLILPGNSSADYPLNIDIDLVGNGGILSVMSFLREKHTYSVDGSLKARSFLFQKTVNYHKNDIGGYLKALEPYFKNMSLF